MEVCEVKKGLVILHTGTGKGKTTAALGLALRAAGQGLKVCFIQFIKGRWEPGEKEAFSRFPGLIDFCPLGDGFISKSGDRDASLILARNAWDYACGIVGAGEHDMVVLDEVTWLLPYKVVVEADITRLIEDKPERLHLVLTGRKAPQSVIDASDLVTEMKEIKHPYRDQGVTAQKGIEF